MITMITLRREPNQVRVTVMPMVNGTPTRSILPAPKGVVSGDGCVKSRIFDPYVEARWVFLKPQGTPKLWMVMDGLLIYMINMG